LSEQRREGALRRGSGWKSYYKSGKGKEEDVLRWSPMRVELFWERVDKRGHDECWEWRGYQDKGGYGRYSFGGNTFLAHRVAFILASGKPIPSGLCILHKCDNRSCCNPNHLKPGTIAENNLDMALKGRSAKGERNPKARLTNEEVLRIRKLHHSGVPLKELASLFNVHRGVIYKIVRRRTWTHIQGPISTRSREEMKGEGNPNAKLEKAKVIQIREKHYKGVQIKELANEFGVSRDAIYRIVTGRTWTCTGGPISIQHTRGPISTRSREEMKGEGNPNAKLTETAVVQIREKYRAGVPVSVLADEFGVTQNAIRNIVKGRTWKHVGGPVESHSGKRKSR